MKPIDQWIYTSFRSGAQGSGYQTYQSTEGIGRPEDEELVNVTKYSSDPEEIGSRPAFGIRRLRSERWVVFTAHHSKDEGGRGNYFVHALVGRLEDFHHAPYLLRGATLPGGPLFRGPLSREEAMGSIPIEALQQISGDSIEVNSDWEQRINAHLQNYAPACLPLVSKVLGGSKPRPLLMVGEEDTVLCAFALLWQVCIEKNRQQLSCMTLCPARNSTEFIITGWPEVLGRPSPSYLDRFSGVYSWSANQSPAAERPHLLDVEKWKDLLPSAELPAAWIPKEVKPIGKVGSQSHANKGKEAEIEAIVQLLEGSESEFERKKEALNKKFQTLEDVNALEDAIRPRMLWTSTWGWFRWVTFRHECDKLEGVSEPVIQKFLISLDNYPKFRTAFTRYFVSKQDRLSTLEPILAALPDNTRKLITQELAAYVLSGELAPSELAKTCPRFAGGVLGRICTRLPTLESEWQTNILEQLSHINANSEISLTAKADVVQGFLEISPLTILPRTPIGIAWSLLQLAASNAKLCDTMCPKIDDRASDFAKMINEEDFETLTLTPGCDFRNWPNLRAFYEACQLFGTPSWYEHIIKHAKPFGMADEAVRSALFSKTLSKIIADKPLDASCLIMSVTQANPEYGREIRDLAESRVQTAMKRGVTISYDKSAVAEFVELKLAEGTPAQSASGGQSEKKSGLGKNPSDPNQRAVSQHPKSGGTLTNIIAGIPESLSPPVTTVRKVVTQDPAASAGPRAIDDDFTKSIGRATGTRGAPDEKSKTLVPFPSNYFDKEPDNEKKKIFLVVGFTVTIISLAFILYQYPVTVTVTGPDNNLNTAVKKDGVKIAVQTQNSDEPQEGSVKFEKLLAEGNLTLATQEAERFQTTDPAQYRRMIAEIDFRTWEMRVKPALDRALINWQQQFMQVKSADTFDTFIKYQTALDRLNIAKRELTNLLENFQPGSTQWKNDNNLPPNFPEDFKPLSLEEWAQAKNGAGNKSMAAGENSGSPEGGFRGSTITDIATHLPGTATPFPQLSPSARISGPSSTQSPTLRDPLAVWEFIKQGGDLKPEGIQNELYPQLLLAKNWWEKIRAEDISNAVQISQKWNENLDNPVLKKIFSDLMAAQSEGIKSAQRLLGFRDPDGELGKATKSAVVTKKKELRYHDTLDKIDGQFLKQLRDYNEGKKK